MRNDYFYKDSTEEVLAANSDEDSEDKLGIPDAVTDAVEEDEKEDTELDMLSPFNYGLGLELWNLLGSSLNNLKRYTERQSRFVSVSYSSKRFIYLERTIFIKVYENV